MMTAADSLLRNDSLRLAAERLFIQGAHLSPVNPTDSLAIADSLQVVVPPATAADLFGAASSVVTTAATTTPLPTLSANPLFQGLVLLLTAVYALFLYYHADDIAVLFSRSASALESITDIPGGSGYLYFLNTACIIGMLMAGVFGVKCIDLTAPVGILPYQAAAGVSLTATAALLAMATLQVGMLYTIGAITLSQPFIKEVLFLRRMVYAITSILTAPIILLGALVPNSSSEIWVYIALGVLVMTTILYLQKSLSLFMRQKISILLWILYLCTVEIFPISLLWLLIARQ